VIANHPELQPKPTVQEIDAAIYGTRENPVHVGALCEVKPDKMYGMNGKPVDEPDFTCGLCGEPSKDRVCQDCKDITELSMTGKIPKYKSPPYKPQPEPEAKKPRKRSAKQLAADAIYNQRVAIIDAVYDVSKRIKRDPKSMYSKKNLKQAGVLVDLGATSKDIPDYYSWLQVTYRRNDWMLRYNSIFKEDNWQDYEKERGEVATASQEITFEIEDDDFIVTQDEN
jgi:hypothetical protein